MYIFEYISRGFTVLKNTCVILLDVISLIIYGLICLTTIKPENLVYSPFVRSSVGIVLLHGSSADSREFIAGIEYLKRRNCLFHIFTFNYTQDRYTKIETLEQSLKSTLIEWAQFHNINSFVLVGHSLGGLIGAGAMNDIKNGKYDFNITKLITINTPWQGVPLLAKCPSSWKTVIQTEMEPCSAFICELNKKTQFESVLAMESSFDMLVDYSQPFNKPNQTETLNILSGHYSAVCFPSVWDRVLNAIYTG